MPALVLAAESGQDAIVRLLLTPLQTPVLPPFELSSTGPHQRTALMAAASNGHRSTALLLVSTADQHVRASVELITKRRSNLEFEPGQGVIATAVAASNFRSTLLNKPDENNTTALMMAAAHGWQDLVEMMLKGGADPRAKNNNGYTSSMIAADAGYTALSDYLRAAEQKQ
jgi:ankyrin repeat protein